MLREDKIKDNDSFDEHNYYKIVQRHRDEYQRRPALRQIYSFWADQIREQLATVQGKSIEIGSGCGALADHLDIIKTDIYKHEWIDEVVDVCDMHYKDNTCSNIVAVDVLHHLPDLSIFLTEVDRVLAEKGRLIILEPYISFFSYFIYRFLHHEPLDSKACPFEPVTLLDPESKEPCNSALPTSLFIKNRAEINRRWPELHIKKVEFTDFLVFPLTGGFSHRSWLKPEWIKPLKRFEQKLLKYLGRFLAMRIFVVIEKVSEKSPTSDHHA